MSPALDAVSGASTHANMLLASPLAEHFDLLHFQVGSEGRRGKTAGSGNSVTTSRRIAIPRLRRGCRAIRSEIFMPCSTNRCASG